MADCPSLQRANESRRRAWREMQRLRRLLAGAGAPLQPEKKPADFEHEGAALAAGLSWLLLDHADRINLLTRSFVDFRCTVEHQQGPVRYAGARAVMDHLLNVKLLPAAIVEEMRRLSSYEGRDLAKIIREHRGHPLPPATAVPSPHRPEPGSAGPG